MSDLVVLLVSQTVAGHLAQALANYHRLQARDYLPFPDELRSLMSACQEIASGQTRNDWNGLETTPVGDSGVSVQDDGMACGLVDSKATASALDLSPRQLSRISEADLPRVRFGRAVRFDPADIRDLIEKRKTNGEF